MKKITMYSGNPCPYCGAAKALLKTKNVEIEEFDIWKDASKAKEKLGWEPKVNIHTLADIMIEADLKLLKNEKK